MADFDDKLREARQRRGVPPREIADRTKISVAEVPHFERTFERHQRLAGVVLKIIVASLVAIAIMLYLTRTEHSEDQSTAPHRDPGRRTSRRLGVRSSAIIPARA